MVESDFAAPSPESRPGTSRHLELPVQGMTCANCARHVQTALSAVHGVAEASVSFATRRASLDVSPEFTDVTSLVRAIESAGYTVPIEAVPSVDGPRLTAGTRAEAVDRADAAEQAQVRRDFVIALGLSAPLLVLAMSHGALPGSSGPWAMFIQFALATPVVFGPGRRFLLLGARALRHKTSDMNTLVSLGMLSAWTSSTLTLLTQREHLAHEGHGMPPLYFEAAAAIVTFVLLGRLLEARARKRLSDAVRGLVSLVPQLAHRVVGQREIDVPVDHLQVGDEVRIKPGERVPIDGVVTSGNSSIDEAMLTGESLPVDKQEGSKAYGGTLNQAGALTLRVTRIGSETALARIVEAVEQAQGSRAPIARLADVVSAYFVPSVFSVACLTAIGWLSIGGADVSTAMEHFVAVLVIACPCALGLATPAAVAVGTGRGAELGILVKGGVALETLSRVDSILIDKTGTLTSGKPELSNVEVTNGIDELTFLSLVASVEQLSEHPLARAIVAGAKTRGASLRPCQNFKMAPGRGVSGEVDGRAVVVGTQAFLSEHAISTQPLEDAGERLARSGRTPSFVAIDQTLSGLVALADRPSQTAAKAVTRLKSLGIEISMLTGDREGVARAIADEVGIERVIADVRPEGKADAIANEQKRGRCVAMVGDGINDAPALSQANVGIAVGHGAEIALAAADVALMHGGLENLPVAVELSRATMHTIRRNLFWAFAYNVVGIPIAAGALSPFTSWTLSPVLASAAMSLSSVSVLLSSLTLRRFGRVSGSKHGH